MFSKSPRLMVLSLVMLLVGCTNLSGRTSDVPRQPSPAPLTATLSVTPTISDEGLADLVREEVLQDSINAADLRPETFRILGKRVSPRGFIIVYTVDSSRQGEITEWVGASLVALMHGRWMTSGSGAVGSFPTTSAIDYGAITTENRDGPFVMVYGRALQPGIAAVEIIFDNQQIISDTAEDGIFAGLSSEAALVCAIRVLDAQHREIERRDLSFDDPRCQ